MAWLLYNVLFAVGFLVLLPRYLLRMRRRGGYARHFWQRIGRYEPEVMAQLQAAPRIWVHAVSVGELYIALRLMQVLRMRSPARRFVLTVTTSTAHAIARDALPAEDVLLYFPVDFPLVTRRVLRCIRPVALILMECELWPNLIRLTRKTGAPVAVVNGRVSEHSYRGYRKVRFFTRKVLPLVDLFCAQSASDRDRLIALGAAPTAVHVLGSAKYDVASVDAGDTGEAEAVLRAVGIREEHLVLLGGSTWPGEEEALLDAYIELRQRWTHLALILVPRHFERAPEVVAEIESRGLRALRRTAVEVNAPPAAPDPEQVLLVDTTGELRHFYACAGVIFVGKSLTEHGGQNILEPSILGKPVIVGPNMENFPVVMQDFLEAGAVLQVPDAEHLKRALEDLVANPGKGEELGRRAARLVQEKRGALEATANRLEPRLAPNRGR